MTTFQGDPELNTLAFYAIAFALFYGVWYVWVRSTGGWQPQADPPARDELAENPTR